MKTFLVLLTGLVLPLLAYADVGMLSDAEEKAQNRVRAAELDKALKVCRSVSGYHQLEKYFRIEDASLGSINMMPPSLFVMLRAIKPRTLDAAWWWNPLANGKPSLTWQDFLKAHAAAEHALSKYSWLTKLRAQRGERTLGLHLFGTRIELINDDWNFFSLPAWKHAGMIGEPTYRVLARRGNNSWIECIFSDKDDRAFIRFALISDPDPQCALDRLDVSWHPRGKRGESSSKYALVEHDGTLKIQTFVLDEQ